MDFAEGQLSRLDLIRSSVALKPLRLSLGFATQGPDVAEADGGINFENRAVLQGGTRPSNEMVRTVAG